MTGPENRGFGEDVSEDSDSSNDVSRRSFLTALGAGAAAVFLGIGIPSSFFEGKDRMLGSLSSHLPTLERDPEKPDEGDVWLRKDLMEE